MGADQLDGANGVTVGAGVDRTVVLLGAGASADAGLPVTSQLASAIIERANKFDDGLFPPGKPDWVRALNVVYAAMVGHQGARGGNPLSAVNIETLVSAVRLLRARDTHEVAPFVASWSPALSSFSSALPTEQGRTILALVAETFRRGGGAEDKMTEAVAAIARSAIRPDLERPLADAEAFILRSLVELLSAHDDVSYFEPLLEIARTQPGGVDVITLNYDLTVEAAASQGEVPVNRGIDRWRPDEELSFPPTDGVLNLVKVHGSLDWRAASRDSGAYQQLSPRGIDVVPQVGLRGIGDRPWIVVGDREKLATDGPTLALNFAAKAALRRGTHLVAVGYSFGDAHINAMIRDWLAGDAGRTMSVLEFQWPREPYYQEDPNFRSALIAQYGRQSDSYGVAVLPRVLPMEGRAAERLRDALFQRPLAHPDPLVTVVSSRSGQAIRLDVTWHGAPLFDASVHARPAGHARQGPGVPLYEGTIDADPLYLDDPRYGEWLTGVSKTVFASADGPARLDLTIEGGSLMGGQHWTGTVDTLGSGQSEPAAQ